MSEKIVQLNEEVITLNYTGNTNQYDYLMPLCNIVLLLSVILNILTIMLIKGYFQYMVWKYPSFYFGILV